MLALKARALKAQSNACMIATAPAGVTCADAADSLAERRSGGERLQAFRAFCLTGHGRLPEYRAHSRIGWGNRVNAGSAGAGRTAVNWRCNRLRRCSVREVDAGTLLADSAGRAGGAALIFGTGCNGG
jgi:hypothetical protein